MQTNNSKYVRIDNTRFIFSTNFSGDPDRDKFHSSARKASIIIPDENMALAMIEEGFNVKTTRPREGEEDDFTPKYFISISVNYDTEWPPKIYLVTDGEANLLSEDTVGTIDKIYVKNVNVILNKFQNKTTGKPSLYVRTMYVEQDIEDDPYACIYRKKVSTFPIEDDDPPFDI